jgi:8-oxo-dGTP pyrophosphatase MutT (NUDIX family)
MEAPSVVVRQAGAIPVRDGQVCIVSSRSGKRWVVPKGWLEAGKTAGEVALQEAWEEAGVTGTLRPQPAGTYLYQKDGRTFHVTVFVLEVTESLDSWPERGLRERCWLTPSEAMSRIEDVGLREILRVVAGCHTGEVQVV